MKIALIGNGAMGKTIARLAGEAGHEITAFVDETDSDLPAAELAEKLGGADVAIDFTTAGAVVRNVEACIAANIPLVEGTTGWDSERSRVGSMVAASGIGFVVGANFSVGVNLFYRVVDHAAELFAKFPEYQVFVEEQHHSRKKDAPSGTALKLKQVISEHSEVNEISSTRAGNIPGTHRVGFDGVADQVLLTHTARSREGFALGAIMAAEWIIGKSGHYEFAEVMDEIVK